MERFNSSLNHFTSLETALTLLINPVYALIGFLLLIITSNRVDKSLLPLIVSPVMEHGFLVELHRLNGSSPR